VSPRTRDLPLAAQRGLQRKPVGLNLICPDPIVVGRRWPRTRRATYAAGSTPDCRPGRDCLRGEQPGPYRHRPV
jgi:hypothetical protein